jgi:hypothetical protein
LNQDILLMSQAVIPDWATPENRKKNRQRPEVTVVRTFDLPHRGAKYRQIAKLMGCRMVCHVKRQSHVSMTA